MRNKILSTRDANLIRIENELMQPCKRYDWLCHSKRNISNPNAGRIIANNKVFWQCPYWKTSTP